MAADKGISLHEYGVKYFDSRRKTRGNRNPLRKQEWKERQKGNKDALIKRRIELKEEIKVGKHNRLLTKCGISGMRYKAAELVPARVKMSKSGGFDTLRVLIHKEFKVGMKFEERTILSITTESMAASIKMAQIGHSLAPYVHIYTITPVTT